MRWICPNCQTNNMPASASCFRCGTPQDATLLRQPSVRLAAQGHWKGWPALAAVALLIALAGIGAFVVLRPQAVAPAPTPFPAFPGFAPAATTPPSLVDPHPELAVRVNGFRYTQNLSSSGAARFPPHAGKAFLIVNVTVTNQGTDPVEIDAEHFRLFASDHQLYRSYRLLFFTPPGVISATLLQGGSQSGDVIFEVNPGAVPEKVQFDP